MEHLSEIFSCCCKDKENEIKVTIRSSCFKKKKYIIINEEEHIKEIIKLLNKIIDSNNIDAISDKKDR